MANHRRFVPSFDFLGLRITPSDLNPVASGTIAVEPAIKDDNLGLPGENALLIDTINWALPTDPQSTNQLTSDDILSNVDWILPVPTSGAS